MSSGLRQSVGRTLPKRWKQRIKQHLTTRFHGSPQTQPRFTNYGATGDLVFGGTSLILPQPFASRAFEWLKSHPEDMVEAEVFRKLAAKADGLLFDVGAHVGFFAVLFCKSCGHNVLAFEPVPELRALINATAGLNNVEAKRIEVIGKAVGEESGVIKLHVDPATGFAQIQPVHGQSPASMDVTTIDLMRGTMETRIALLKIDVEGFEAEVLQGACETLRRDRPVVLVEIHNACLAERGVDLKSVLDRVIGQGYSLMRLNGRTITASALTRAFLQRSHVIAVPKQKLSFYERLLSPTEKLE